MRLYEPDDKLSDDRLGEPSKAIRQRVEAAREIQQARFEGKCLTSNAGYRHGRGTRILREVECITFGA